MSIKVAPDVSPPRVSAQAAPSVFNVQRLREDFPILGQKVRGKPLAYLDNAATAQKPRAVLDALQLYYSADNANIHRAVHLLSERATQAYEQARVKVKSFLRASDEREIIFVRGTTEGINLVAQTYGRKNVREGDEILITAMEHHSNIVPWQMLCEEKGARLRVAPVSDVGELRMDEFEKLLTARTRLVAVAHVSNALGTVNPVQRIVELAHARGVPVLVDGAQSVMHMPVNVRELGCDFFVFSGHKVFGPTGVGVLYGRETLLEAMPPWQGGGDMIQSVSFEKTTYKSLPNKFEAGTPHIAGVIGLGAAIDYLEDLDWEAVAAYEDALLRHATDRLRQIPGLRILGDAAHKLGVISFVVEDPPISALDIGVKLDLEGIAVRTGHHCCQPLMERFGVPGTVRASLAMYNTMEEVDRLADVLQEIVAEAADRTTPSGGTSTHSSDAFLAAPECEYPAARADSPQAAAEEMAEVFEFLEDWPARYEQIIDLGRKLPPLPAHLKTDANRIRGCQATVHMSLRQRPDERSVVEFLAHADAEIVNGLIALLEWLFSGQKADQIVAFDVEGFFRRVGLDQHLSLNRRNGLDAMVRQIRKFAAAAAPVPTE